MDFFFNSTTLRLNQSLFNAVGSAAAARTARVAAIARNSGPSAPNFNADQSRLDARARESTRQVEGFSKLKVRQQRAVKTVEKATERLTEMKNILLEARELITNAQKTGVTAEAQRDLANSFDQKLGKLNLRAKGAGNFGVNLIGASIRDIFEANDLEVQIKPGSLVTTTYTGKFLGSDYVLTDGSGDTFLPNIFGSSLAQFPNADPNDSGVLLKDDDTVVFDHDTGALSITRAGDGSPTLTGTVERKGIGVLHSYFYGNFQDATLRDKALEEVDAALGTLRVQISLFESKRTRAEVAVNFSQGQIDENRDTAAGIQAQKEGAERRFVLEEQKRQFLFESALQTALSYNSQGLSVLLQDAASFGFEA
ncbi:MAG: hypothetical protein GKS00_05215 [Alphaproteobacteria bacterium]|nr:hypothetical protein [Alphaproteobacteria bacterium]